MAASKSSSASLLAKAARSSASSCTCQQHTARAQHIMRHDRHLSRSLSLWLCTSSDSSFNSAARRRASSSRRFRSSSSRRLRSSSSRFSSSVSDRTWTCQLQCTAWFGTAQESARRRTNSQSLLLFLTGLPLCVGLANEHAKVVMSTVQPPCLLLLWLTGLDLFL